MKAKATVRARGGHVRQLRFPKDGIVMPVISEFDIVSARQRGRTLALEQGFSTSDATLIAFVISELARDLLLFAREGEIVLLSAVQEDKLGVLITARFKAPTVPNITEVIKERYSMPWIPGQGVPGLGRLVDGFEVVSEIGGGAIASVKKWRR